MVPLEGSDKKSRPRRRSISFEAIFAAILWRFDECLWAKVPDVVSKITPKIATTNKTTSISISVKPLIDFKFLIFDLCEKTSSLILNLKLVEGIDFIVTGFRLTLIGGKDLLIFVKCVGYLLGWQSGQLQRSVKPSPERAP